MKLLTYRDICEITGKSRATIHRWVRQGRFPAPKQIGPNSVAFDADEVKQWLQSCKSAA